MNAIGGYLQLELNDNKTIFHDNAIAVNSGRNALEYILLSNKLYKKIYMPYYICDVILQPIKRLKIDYEFYKLTPDFEPDLGRLKKNEVMIYVNYFGIMNQRIKNVLRNYKNVIVDNSQAFFAKPITNVPSFYSPRKFFGLPDGGFAYTSKQINIDLKRDKSITKFSHLLKRWEDGAAAGFDLFKRNEAKLNNKPLHTLSIMTERLLRNINFDSVLKEGTKIFIFCIIN